MHILVHMYLLYITAKTKGQCPKAEAQGPQISDRSLYVQYASSTFLPGTSLLIYCLGVYGPDISTAVRPSLVQPD